MYFDWNICVFNVGCIEVSVFFVVFVFVWVCCYYVDGICVDVVVLMLYCDYLCKEGEWVLNVYGGCENFELVVFLCWLNDMLYGDVVLVGVVIVVEELIVWLGVIVLIGDGGFGFDFKWNMGWMYDMFVYLYEDLIYCCYYYDWMMFGFVYVFFECFVLLLLYDEVVYGKGLFVVKMLGDVW